MSLDGDPNPSVIASAAKQSICNYRMDRQAS